MEGTKRFVRYLKTRNLRSTAERRAILEGIARMKKRHFSADDLVHSFRQCGLPVSRATAYRTLDHLVRCGLIRRLSLGGRAGVFERVPGAPRHEHMICSSCGGVLEFDAGGIRRALGEACRRRRFRPQRYVLRVVGLCRTCAPDSTRDFGPVR